MIAKKENTNVLNMMSKNPFAKIFVLGENQAWRVSG